MREPTIVPLWRPQDFSEHWRTGVSAWGGCKVQWTASVLHHQTIGTPMQPYYSCTGVLNVDESHCSLSVSEPMLQPTPNSTRYHRHRAINNWPYQYGSNPKGNLTDLWGKVINCALLQSRNKNWTSSWKRWISITPTSVAQWVLSASITEAVLQPSRPSAAVYLSLSHCYHRTPTVLSHTKAELPCSA